MRPWIVCLLVSLLAQPSTSAPGSTIDSLLTAQRERAGGRAEAWFAPLESASSLGDPERGDYRFLLAHLPLSDLAGMDPARLRENIVLAREARKRLPWGASVPDDLWRTYVLPHRVSQEPFVSWRRAFLDELAPRLEGLSMSEAALEVNHWCHEQATYQPTDGRDQDPLTTCRRGLGRCEEEMILTIAALRAVGIPARQCYTPFWAHSNDNHAWVEVWTEGRWHYLGACEPAPELDQAWFSGPARRAMLVVSTAYGDDPGPGEHVLRREGRSASVNSTAVYGPVKTLRLQVVDEKERPRPGQRVVFHLYNYGGWMPALAQTTDAQGRLELACGLGSWLVAAGDGSRAGLLHVAPEVEEAVLVLGPRRAAAVPERVEYIPPPESREPDRGAGLVFAEGIARGLVDTAAVRQADQVFQRRLAREDSLRSARVWSSGDRQRGLPERDAPDSLALLVLQAKARAAGRPDGEILQRLRASLGNHGEISAFLDAGDDLALRLELLSACSDKDLAELEASTLVDHLRHLTPAPGEEDSLARTRWAETVLPPRLDREPCLAWRGALAEFFRRQPALAESPGDRRLRRWIRRNLRLDEGGDRLGAPLTPAQVLELGGGTAADLERFWLGACRARGLAARRHPHHGGLELWEKGAWRAVDLLPRKGDGRPGRTGQLTLVAADSVAAAGQGLRDWCLARWEDSHLEALDLGWEQPLSALAMPLELPAGRYVLSTGRRRPDGSAVVRLAAVEVESGASVTLPVPGSGD